MPTVEDVARWMLEQVRQGHLYQEQTVYEIHARFGEQFTYQNDAGNLAIGRDVLKAFRKISEADVVWDKYERAWRLRDQRDAPGRQQN